MSSLNTISIDKPIRLIGTPACPTLIDVQTDEDFAADPRLVPGAVRRPWAEVADWAPEFDGRPAVVVCQKRLKLSQGVAAWLRHAGLRPEVLEGGALAWGPSRAADDPTPSCGRATPRAAQFGLPARPQVDRIARRGGRALESSPRHDVMLEAFGLRTPALDVGPDRSRRLGLSRMFAEDLLQLEAGMPPHSEKSKCATA